MKFGNKIALLFTRCQVCMRISTVYFGSYRGSLYVVGCRCISVGSDDLE